ncbi:fusaric acid resistance protein [Psychromonas marina]|uniref:Fusaric acid resistance protein n=1 Tax=Psychromonas marina TaxID=88364 RepID=A0ABQ6E0T4_9GAMM|nr:FUSC family protein [Psychromonas marina]GLS90795.1 fusaric acid resistance protein [Psychromonas marina]
MKFNPATQEAIKVGLAVALAVLSALAFGWDKAYWSAITVFVVAATESYSYAIKKGQNRLVGTLIGIAFAVFLLAIFPQNHLVFICVYCAFLALCVYFSSHNSWGYAATIAFTVCAIVVCSGGFDASTTFNIAIVRTLQTLLGVVIYTLVFRLIWPKKTEDLFFTLLPLVISDQKKRIAQLRNNNRSIKQISLAQQQRVNKLNEILTLPLNGSDRLRNQRKIWCLMMSVIMRLESLLTQYEQADNHADEIMLGDLIAGEKLIAESMLSIKDHKLDLTVWLLKTKNRYSVQAQRQNTFLLPLKNRFKNVVKALCILTTCLAMWIYIPLPGGYIVPMLASILANVLVTLPDNAIKHAGLGTIIWGVFFLSQYVFILPSATEAWQLGAYLFLNAVFIWKTCSAPSLGIQKVLAGNLAVVLPMGALQLTPSYSMETPLLMMMLVFICVGVAGFYTKLFSTD